MLKKHSYPVFSAALLGTLLSFGQVSVAAEQEEYIPADTLFYLGSGRPLPVEDLFALMPDFATIREDNSSSRLNEMGNFLDDPAAQLATWGIEDQVSFSVYSVGLSPVLRLSLSDSGRFLQSLGEYETKNDLESQPLEQDGWTIRVYSSDRLRSSNVDTAPQDDSSRQESESTGVVSGDDTVSENTGANTGSDSTDNTTAGSDNSTESPTPAAPALDKSADADLEKARSAAGPYLVIGVSEEEAVAGFVTEAGNDDAIRQVLGIDKPEQSILANDKLRKFRKQWQYGDEVAAFVDFQQIAAAITDETNPVAKELQTSSILSSDMRGFLEQLRREPCRAELTQLVSNWPMLVAGYRQFEVSEKQVDFDSHAAVVIGHEKLKETLSLFRGLLPSSQSSSEPMISLGLGLTVDNLAQALGQLNEMAASVRYQCQPLYPLNSIAASDLSAVSMGVVMFGGMARGVRGLSVNVFDADINPVDGYSAVKSIDTAIALSADDPALLIGTLKMLPQFGALGNLPADGTEIDVTSSFPLPLPPGTEIKAAIKGSNVVLFSGEKSTDFANRLAQNETEGFFKGKANTRLILQKLTASMANLGDEDGREQIRSILDRYLQGELSYSLEFTDNGVEVVSKGQVDRRDAREEPAK